MKKKQNLKLWLNKERISELSNSNKQKIMGGITIYDGTCPHCGGGGGTETQTCALYTCAACTNQTCTSTPC